jgi:hypothetical protein
MKVYNNNTSNVKNYSFLNASININQYNSNNIILLEPIKNNIIEKSKFIRILYSDSNIIMNGLSIFLTFNIINYIYDNSYNNLMNTYRYKIIADKERNNDIINFIKNIENDIYNKIIINNKHNIKKRFNCKLTEQMNTYFIKFTNEIKNPNKQLEKTNNFILKISGIWETETEFGITYKFLDYFD